VKAPESKWVINARLTFRSAWSNYRSMDRILWPTSFLTIHCLCGCYSR